MKPQPQIQDGYEVFKSFASLMNNPTVEAQAPRTAPKTAPTADIEEGHKIFNSIASLINNK